MERKRSSEIVALLSEKNRLWKSSSSEKVAAIEAKVF